MSLHFSQLEQSTSAGFRFSFVILKRIVSVHLQRKSLDKLTLHKCIDLIIKVFEES